MVDAGRAGPYRFGGEPPYGSAETCQASVPVEPQYFTRCGEPIAAVAPHPTVPTSVLNLCIVHGTQAYERGAAVQFRCSVCGKPYRWPSSLDSSGRGEECRS
jgi:hypothetical protein